MPQPDPWKILGVTPGASKAEIRRAYRRLARRHHPDVNPADPDAAERFKEVQSAYDTLTGRQSGQRPEHHPSRPDGMPQRTPFSADEDPFLSVLAAYLRQRGGCDR